MVEDDRDIDIETDGDDEVNGRVRKYRVYVTTTVTAALLPVTCGSNRSWFSVHIIIITCQAVFVFS